MNTGFIGLGAMGYFIVSEVRPRPRPFVDPQLAEHRSDHLLPVILPIVVYHGRTI